MEKLIVATVLLSAVFLYITLKKKKKVLKTPADIYTPQIFDFLTYSRQGTCKPEKPRDVKGVLTAFPEGAGTGQTEVWVIEDRIHWDITGNFSPPKKIKYGWLDLPVTDLR